MKYSSSARWASAFAVFTAVLISCGCSINMLAIPYYLFVGEQKLPPPKPLVEGKKDRKKVAVISYVDNALRFSFDSLDSDLESMVSMEMAKNEKRVDVVQAKKIRNWRDKNPGWIDASLQSVGEKFDANYVIFIEISEFSLSADRNQFLYQGRAKVSVKLHDVSKDSVEYADSWVREYPPNRPVDMREYTSEDQFRNKFLAVLAKEVAWHFVPHSPDDRAE